MNINQQLKQMHKLMQNNTNKRTLYGYVLDHGREMLSGNLDTEQYDYLMQVKEKAKVQCLPKQCYYNSQALTLADNENRIKYFEGVCLRENNLFFHAWNTLDNVMIDTTLTFKRSIDLTRLSSLKDRILGTLPDNTSYYGTDYDKAYISETWLKHKHSIALIDNWQDNYPLLNY